MGWKSESKSRDRRDHHRGIATKSLVSIAISTEDAIDGAIQESSSSLTHLSPRCDLSHGGWPPSLLCCGTELEVVASVEGKRKPGFSISKMNYVCAAAFG